MTKTVNRNCSEEAPMLNLLSKIFKAAITDMLKKKWKKHVWRMRRKYENNVLPKREYQQRDRNYKRKPSRNSEVEKCSN